MSMMRSSEGFKMNEAKLKMRPNGASHPLMLGPGEGWQQVVLADHLLHPGALVVLLQASSLAQALKELSQIGSQLYLMAPGMVPRCPERAGVARDTNPGLRPSLPQETPGLLQIQTLTQGGGASDTERWTMVTPVNIACPGVELVGPPWAPRTRG